MTQKLDKLEKLLVRAVIENTIDQLAIVGGTIQLSLPIQSISSSNVHQNATNKPLKDLILRENKQYQKLKKRLNLNEMALRLLSVEANYVQSVLEETLEEVEESGTFLALEESVNKSRERNKEKTEIGEEEQFCREENSSLREKVDQAKFSFETDVNQQSMEVAHLKDALLEARRASKGQEIYADQLEHVREDESIRVMQKREADLVTEITRLQTEIAHENRVNMEIESWLRDRHTFLTNLHAIWTKKLRDDVAAKESELQKLKDARDYDKQALTLATSRYAEAKIFIDKTKEQMKLVQHAKEQMALEIRAAIKIQSWWKMLMVRKCLGPYKKKKKTAADAAKPTPGKPVKGGKK